MAVQLPPRLILVVLTVSCSLLGRLVLPGVVGISAYAGLLFAFTGLTLLWALLRARGWVPAVAGWPRSPHTLLLYALGLGTAGVGFLTAGLLRIILLGGGAAIAVLGWWVDDDRR